MPIYEFWCKVCDEVFERLVFQDGELIRCPNCKGSEIEKIISAPSIKINEDVASKRIRKRLNYYLKAGKLKDAKSFIEKASSYVKTDAVKRMADKVHSLSNRKGSVR